MMTPYSPEHLKQIRHDLGLSQGGLADLIGVDISWITKREQGTNRMSKSDITLYRALVHMRDNGCLDSFHINQK